MYKTLAGAKSLHIRFDKIDGFIRVYDGTRYLVLFGAGKFHFIYNRIWYLKVVLHVIFHNYAKIKVDSYYSLPLEKSLTLHNVIILIKSVFYIIKIYSNCLKIISFCVNYRCYIMIESMLLKELILTEQLHQKRLIFVFIGVT